MKTFYLPDLGEGLPEGEITEWHVKEGDIVKTDDPLVSIETAKAVVDVPSPYAGTVKKLHGKAGDIIPTGKPLVDFEVAQSTESPSKSSTVAGEIKEGNQIITEKPIAVATRGATLKVLPAVRALAKKLNVDLASLHPSGVDGTITADDVKKASQGAHAKGDMESLRGVRRAMALGMAKSHAEVVPVTIFDDADITKWVKEKDFTPRIILAIVKACFQEPSMNAWFNTQMMGRTLFSYVHVGLAMDTQDGLFVPVIKDAQNKSVQQLKDEIQILKKEVTERTIEPSKLQGATITLSNFGKFTGRYATPIISPPTVAILGIGALYEGVIPYEGKPAIRSLLPLSLSFDHRIVTGGEATRFLGVVKEYLQNTD